MRDVREPEREQPRDTRERDRPGQGPITLAKSDRAAEREKFEQQRQLDQEFPALVKDEKLDEGGSGAAGSGGVPGSIIVKQREDTKRSESPATPTVAGIGRSIGRRDSVTEKPLPKLRTAVKLIDENHTFCDNIADFLSDNTDFMVIGILGLQNSGKSTIINALAKLANNEEDVFRVQTYEHQMLGEHCTNGIDVFINGRRMIFLDCQPLLSASVMDRTIQLEKKYTSEFNSTENTMEVHSLQMIGFLFSICHTVLLVQDWFVDINLIRLMAAAEMLKPVTSSGDDQHIQEYFPHLVIVHNKAEMSDLEQDHRQEMEDFYGRVLAKSRLQWRDGAEVTEDKPLLQVMPDHEGDYSEETTTRRKISLHPSFEDAVKSLRKQVFSLKRTPLSQGRLNEKSWLSLASRTWDNIKNSSFYMEYSRLLP